MNLVKQLRSFFLPTEDPFFKRFFMSGSVDFSSSVIALSRKKSKNQLTSGLSRKYILFQAVVSFKFAISRGSQTW